MISEPTAVTPAPAGLGAGRRLRMGATLTGAAAARPATMYPGRLRPLLGLALLYLSVGGAVRVLLQVLFGVDAGVSWVALPPLLSAGVINDGVALLYAMLPLHLYLAATPERWFRARLQRRLLFLGIALAAFAVLFSAAVELFFFEEFDSRFNLVAVDYLVYPHEVLINIRDSYPLLPVLAVCAALALLAAVALWRRFAPPTAPTPLRRRVRWLLAHLVLLAAVVALFSTRTLAHFDNRVANEIEINGLASFVEALRTQDIDYELYYRTGADEDLSPLLRQDLERGGSVSHRDGQRRWRTFPAHSGQGGAISLQGAGNAAPNVVLVVEESLGAEFLGAYGSEQGLSPHFDALARRGLLARHAYATGTRTVRGLEAIVASFPPIPSVSILRRPGSDHIANLGSVLRQRGYRTSFLYGGYAHFDDMAAFFGGNGFEVSDRADIDDPAFANIWGVSDQDLFRHALRLFDRYAAQERPFLSVVLTTSNHKPFTFPPGIPGVAPQGGGRQAGVRYADHALGEMMRQAEDHGWFHDTLFVVVGDHGARVYGAADIPLASYEVPILFYAPELLAAGEIEVRATQLDIAPTVLGLLGQGYAAPFYGQDLLALDPSEERTLLFNHNHDVGLLRGDELVVLGLHRRVTGFHWDAATRVLEPAVAGAQIADLATAYFQLADEQFRHGLYR